MSLWPLPSPLKFDATLLANGSLLNCVHLSLEAAKLSGCLFVAAAKKAAGQNTTVAAAVVQASLVA